MRFLAVLIVLGCFPVFAQDQNDVLQLIQVLAIQADSQQNQGNYSESESSRRQLISVMERAGAPPPEIARQLSNLASVLNLSGKPAEAQGLCERAQAILEDNPTDDPVQEAVLLGNLAQALRLQGDLEGARSKFEQELLLLSNLGLDATHFAASAMVGIGAIDAESGNLVEAVARYEVALPIILGISDESHPTTARILEEYEEIKSALEE